jgi:hypothetical protein
VIFVLPATLHGGEWTVLVDTCTAQLPEGERLSPGTQYRVAGRSLMLLCSPRVGQNAPGSPTGA